MVFVLGNSGYPVINVFSFVVRQPDSFFIFQRFSGQDNAGRRGGFIFWSHSGRGGIVVGESNGDCSYRRYFCD